MRQGKAQRCGAVKNLGWAWLQNGPQSQEPGADVRAQVLPCDEPALVAGEISNLKSQPEDQDQLMPSRGCGASLTSSVTLENSA